MGKAVSWIWQEHKAGYRLGPRTLARPGEHSGGLTWSRGETGSPGGRGGGGAGGVVQEALFLGEHQGSGGPRGGARTPQRRGQERWGLTGRSETPD